MQMKQERRSRLSAMFLSPFFSNALKPNDLFFLLLVGFEMSPPLSEICSPFSGLLKLPPTNSPLKVAQYLPVHSYASVKMWYLHGWCVCVEMETVRINWYGQTFFFATAHKRLPPIKLLNNMCCWELLLRSESVAFSKHNCQTLINTFRPLICWVLHLFLQAHTSRLLCQKCCIQQRETLWSYYCSLNRIPRE